MKGFYPVLGLVFLIVVCIVLLAVDYETFSVTYTPPPPPKTYTYDDMLSIERQRAAQQTKVLYIAVDDQDYKVFALLSKAIGTPPTPVALQLASAIGFDTKDKGIFYGFVSDLRSILTRNNRIDLVPYIAGNAANILYARYPFSHIKTFSLQTLAPRKYAKQDAFIDLITVPMAWVDGLVSSDTAKRPLGEYKQDVQQFYAMFVPFSHPPLHQAINETFTNKPITLKISVPLESIKVLKMIRDVHTRLSVYALEVSGHLGGVKVDVGDQLLLLNQQHRSIDGMYYVVSRNKDVIVLESTKQDVKKIQPGDRVYSSVVQLGGVVDENRKVVYLNDVTTRAQKESCISNPNIQTRTMCESRFDLFGKPKKELDVWDRPCEYDNDCPFFNVSNFRGGCKLGVCEMPLGAKQVGFRKYFVEKPEYLNLWTLTPFQEAIKNTHQLSQTIEGFTQENPFHPGERQYVYFTNQPNAPLRDTELMSFLNKIIGRQTQNGKELQNLLELSGLLELNYYIPIHKQVSPTKWQCVVYKFETVEGHTIEFKVIDNIFTSVNIMGRVPEQVIHNIVYSSS